LATQFRATPPEDEVLHSRLPVHVAPDAQHDVFGDGLNAGRQVHMPLLDVRLGIGGGPPKSSSNLAFVIVSPWQ
jgi:hypothetical protein